MGRWEKRARNGLFGGWLGFLVGGVGGLVSGKRF